MDLREKYDTFIYDSYLIKETASEIEIEYIYKINEYEFKPKVTIDKKNITNKNIDNSFFEYLVFNFGIINAISYYKLTCSPKMVINCGHLDEEQKSFFKKLFYNGLGEMMYVNKLNIGFDEFLEIETSDKQYDFIVQDEFEGNLIPIGGGKDSIVTLELLESEHNINSCFLYKRNIYPTDLASLNTIYTAGYTDSDIISFNVTLDPLMLQLNKEGFYNGHIPFSSCLAFAAYMMAYLNNKKYVVLSNEASANEGNVAGTEINHQYSKSFEFENDFRSYTDKYFTPHIQYFSLLRCWNEFQIVKEFIKHPKYLNVFRSCNRGTKTNSWCADCSKCLYVYIMLYPFLSKEQLVDIFGKDMLDEESYKDILVGLISDNHDKPFECVGTKEEISYALSLGITKNEHLPVLLEFYKNNFYDKSRVYDVENYFNDEHLISKKFLNMMGYDFNEEQNYKLFRK